MLSLAQADGLAELPLAGIGREYPNKLDHVLNGDGDLLSPRALHPAFYGCFDWHSAVHGHWTLVRLLRSFRLTREPEIRAALAANLTMRNIAAEVAYLHQPNREFFERPYGWAWLLKLALELETWDDPQGREWAVALRPLAEEIERRFLEFLPRQTYPVRTGLHSNTAFALIFALEYAQGLGRTALGELIVERAYTYFGSDHDYPAHLEPSGADFLSPCLTEALLMLRVDPKGFGEWFRRFLPTLGLEEPGQPLLPAEVSDRADAQIGHLDGLNLSRAWCLIQIGDSLPWETAEILFSFGKYQLDITLPHVASGNYNGEHWLATFAVLAIGKMPNRGEE